MKPVPISIVGKRQSVSSDPIGISDHIPADSRFYYHLSNLSDAAGCNELPVVTPMCYCDLRLVEVYADGSREELQLLDIDGELCANLCAGGVYLDSDSRIVCDAKRGPAVAAILTGKFDEQYVRILMHGERPTVCVKIDRAFKTTLAFPASGAYATILCCDGNGISYPVGTLGVVMS